MNCRYDKFFNIKCLKKKYFLTIFKFFPILHRYLCSQAFIKFSDLEMENLNFYCTKMQNFRSYTISPKLVGKLKITRNICITPKFIMHESFKYFNGLLNVVKKNLFLLKTHFP